MAWGLGRGNVVSLSRVDLGLLVLEKSRSSAEWEGQAKSMGEASKEIGHHSSRSAGLRTFSL